MSLSATSRLRRFAVVLFVLAVLSYGLFQARNLIQGPIITIHSPQNGTTVNNALVEISGEAKNISGITLNDQHIFVDEEGNFREQLLLSYGYTIMTIEASDRFGRETKQTLELVYK